MRVHGLPPIMARTTNVLILGTMPGGESFRVKRYYANPRNSFWTIVFSVLGQRPSPALARPLPWKLAAWSIIRRYLRPTQSL